MTPRAMSSRDRAAQLRAERLEAAIDAWCAARSLRRLPYGAYGPHVYLVRVAIGDHRRPVEFPVVRPAGSPLAYLAQQERALRESA